MSSQPKSKFDRIFNRVLDVTLYFDGILIFFLLITVCVDVALRNLVGRPTMWIVEVSGHVLLYLPFVAGAWVLKNDKHVKMDLLFNYMSPKNQALLNSIMFSIGAIVCLAIVWLGSQMIMEMIRTGLLALGVLQALEWPIMIIIPIGFVLLFIEFIRRTRAYVMTWKTLRRKPGPGISQTSGMQGGH